MVVILCLPGTLVKDGMAFLKSPLLWYSYSGTDKIRGMLNKKHYFWGSGLALLFVGVLFFSRSGVFILSDEAELLIYGKNRAVWQAITAGIRLFRPVHILSLPESADEALKLSFIEKKAASRSIIITPIRYEEVAETFKQGHTGTVVLLWGRDYTIDYERDLQRAASIAGPLAVQTGQVPALLLPPFMDDVRRDSLKQAFDRGLTEMGFSQGSILIVNLSEPAVPLSSVTLFPADLALQNLSAPLIVFSGIRDELLPPSVVAVFDDTLWPHIAEIAASYKNDTKISLFSVPRTRKNGGTL
jgi:hypothetical protein